MSEITLHCERRGGGPPLLLLHGNGEDGSYFTHQMDFFSGIRTVYALDTRGHGRSPRGTAPFGMEQFALDLLRFMDGNCLERADILGFSDGGNIALTFALAHPERVGKLILNGANLDPSGVKPHIQIPIVLGYKLASLFAEKSPEAKKNAEILGLMVKEPGIPRSRRANPGYCGHKGHDQALPLPAHRGQPAQQPLCGAGGRPLYCREIPGRLQPGCERVFRRLQGVIKQ